MFTSIRLRIRDFFKRNKRIIFILLILWFVVIMINQFLKSNSIVELNRTTYNEHASIMNSTNEVPKKLQEPINTIIETYFNYCNNKNYDAAYSMVSDECKRIYFPTINEFKEYIDTVFNENKVYYLQNFSNYDNVYVYRIRIFEDLMATGLTGKDELAFYEEKIALKEVEDGKISLSLRQFIKTEKLDNIYEDEYMKIWIEAKDVYYENENYHIKVKNKTLNTLVLQDGQEANEIILNVNSQNRPTSRNDINVILLPKETKEYILPFTKFFDEDDKVNSIIFNATRILPVYTGLAEFKDQELKNAIKLYSVEMPF